MATTAASAVGLFNVVVRRGEGRRVRLKVGDLAPDFELAGSDGRTHRLADSRGREAVVLAWFPKAFNFARAMGIDDPILSDPGGTWPRGLVG